MADRDLRRIERALLFEEEHPLRYLLELSRQGVLRQQFAEIPAIAIPATESSARILGELDLPILFLQGPKVNEFAKDIHAHSGRSGDFLVFDGSSTHYNFELMRRIFGWTENRDTESEFRHPGAIELNNEGTALFAYMECVPGLLKDRLLEYLRLKTIRPYGLGAPSPEILNGSKIFLTSEDRSLFQKQAWPPHWTKFHPHVLAISLHAQSPS